MGTGERRDGQGAGTGAHQVPGRWFFHPTQEGPRAPVSILAQGAAVHDRRHCVQRRRCARATAFELGPSGSGEAWGHMK